MQSRKNKRLLAKNTSANPAETNMGPALAKEILAALFQYAPHRGTGASNAHQAAGRTQPRQPADATPRVEYRCASCGTFNWSDRSICRVCKQPRPANRPAEAGPTRRTNPGTRPGTVAAAATISPGKRAEELNRQHGKQSVLGPPQNQCSPLSNRSGNSECSKQQPKVRSHSI